MGIEVTRDETDKRRPDPLPTGNRPGFVRRWVRIKGYNAEDNVARRVDEGYEPVRRADVPEGHPGLKTSAQQDTTVKRGDLMLYECPVERAAARAKDRAEFVRWKTQGPGKDFRAKGGEGSDTDHS